MKDTKKILQRIKLTVNQSDPSARVYLYGSRARGNARPDSDWDLLILIGKENVSDEDEKKITWPLYDLEFETGEVLSPMVYSEREWFSKYRVTPFYLTVMREGKLL